MDRGHCVAVSLRTDRPHHHAGIECVTTEGRKRDRFKQCLRNFAPTITHSLERAWLWALRNSLAHDFSLYGGKHKFALDSYEPRGRDKIAVETKGVVLVNLWALGNLGNQIVQNVTAAHAAGDVLLRLPVDEMKERYFMAYEVSEVTGTITFGQLNSASPAVTGISYESTSGGASVSAVPPII